MHLERLRAIETIFSECVSNEKDLRIEKYESYSVRLL